jgi:hypothetical protein
MIDGGWRLTLKAPAIVTIGDGVAEASIVPELGAGLADLMIHGGLRLRDYGDYGDTDYDYAITVTPPSLPFVMTRDYAITAITVRLR